MWFLMASNRRTKDACLQEKKQQLKKSCLRSTEVTQVSVKGEHNVVPLYLVTGGILCFSSEESS